jgi:hypothetical protein
MCFIQDTKIPFKDIHTKRMNLVKIIGINKNFMGTILSIHMPNSHQSHHRALDGFCLLGNSISN